MISVSMQTSEIATLFDREMAALLAAPGFQKCPAGHFRKYLAEDVFGHFGYALYTDNRTGEVRAWPVAGVRFQAVERLVSELREKEFDEYGSFTIGKPIGFFMPRWDLAEWVVDSVNDLANVAGQVVEALETYGVPFMERYKSLKDAVEEMSPEHFGGGHDGAKLAVSYVLLGEETEALQVLEHQLARLDKGGYPGANDFRRFAQNLRTRIEADSANLRPPFRNLI